MRFLVFLFVQRPGTESVVNDVAVGCDAHAIREVDEEAVREFRDGAAEHKEPEDEEEKEPGKEPAKPSRAPLCHI